ncbi:hypothetical protein AB6A40_005799 [Gnathostoma spinigerum]|uniref:Uncharacterized protein n=1 Tax=Gnathostoma spinigerum TaxID=75299 RepID=A0ABD6EHM8_9BILA
MIRVVLRWVILLDFEDPSISKMNTSLSSFPLGLGCEQAYNIPRVKYVMILGLFSKKDGKRRIRKTLPQPSPWHSLCSLGVFDSSVFSSSLASKADPEIISLGNLRAPSKPSQ